MNNSSSLAPAPAPPARSDASAALQGASRAFHHQGNNSQSQTTNTNTKSFAPLPSPSPSLQATQNGALTAAMVAAPRRPRSPVTVNTNSTGGSERGGGGGGGEGGGGGAIGAPTQQQLQHYQYQQLHPNMARVDPKSTSFIAATLAASRSASPSSKVNTPKRRMSLGGSSSEASTVDSAIVVDSESIKPMGSLISMFEAGKADIENTGAGLAAIKKKKVKPKTKENVSPTRSVAGSVGDAEDERSMSPAKTPTKPIIKPKPKMDALSLDGSADGGLKPSVPTKPTMRSKTPPPPKTKPLPEVISPKPKRLSKPELPTKLDLPAKPDIKPGLPREVVTSTPEVQSPQSKRASNPKLPRVQPETPPPEATTSASEVVSSKPKPKRLEVESKMDIQSQTPPRLLLRPATQILSPPSRDPEKRGPPTKQSAPAPPKPRGSNRGSSRPVVVNQQRQVASPVTAKVAPPPPQRASRRYFTPSERPRTADSASSNDTFVSASSVQSPERLSPEPSPPSPPPLPSRRRAPISLPPSPTRDTQHLFVRSGRPTNASTSSLALDDLTSAIMASSLASARLTPQHTGGSMSRPMPSKRQRSPHLMQTLRQPRGASDDESSDRHKSGRLHKFHKGKHKHHEGSRRKWREEITPRERKRYEAVWASNRGVLVPPASSSASNPEGESTPSEFVVNVVVRELWKRSRLPADELAEVWDLVNRAKKGMLNRQEFVVGTWLIDQRLRGRKIPTKVSDSVWGSASGMKVVKPRIKPR